MGVVASKCTGDAFARATNRFRCFGLFDRVSQAALDTRRGPETAWSQGLCKTSADLAVSDLTDVPRFLGTGREPGDSEPHVVVLVCGRVVVTVRRMIVPRAATQPARRTTSPEMVEAIEVDICEELTGQITDEQATRMIGEIKQIVTILPAHSIAVVVEAGDFGPLDFIKNLATGDYHTISRERREIQVRVVSW